MVIYSKVKLGLSPDVNALASIIIALVGRVAWSWPATSCAAPSAGGSSKSRWRIAEARALRRHTAAT